jgi:hypothetical protein
MEIFHHERKNTFHQLEHKEVVYKIILKIDHMYQNHIF